MLTFHFPTPAARTAAEPLAAEWRALADRLLTAQCATWACYDAAEVDRLRTRQWEIEAELRRLAEVPAEEIAA